MVCKMLNLNNFYVNKVVRDYAKMIDALLVLKFDLSIKW